MHRYRTDDCLILIDLQKAFDTIDHEILLQKMVHLQFSAQSIRWFISYLTNRTFLVHVEKRFSNPGKLECGVPQGSILGPLLFLLYVNDMPGAVGFEMLLYADDTCLVFKLRTLTYSLKDSTPNLINFVTGMLITN